MKDKKGAAAVEFALVAPVFFLTLLSLVAYGIYFSAAHAVQQLAADAARTAVAGINPSERQNLVTEFVTKSTLEHSLLEKSRLTLRVQTDTANPNQFTVALSYDASNLPVFNLFSYAMPEKEIRRFATVRVGGL